jgi:RNA polymerase sigma-70 factor (ECF subfamily)
MSFRDQELIEQMPNLRRFAISLARDGDKADDLVQDCMIRALSNRKSFETGTNLRSWLFKILHNLFIDGHRRRVSRPTLADGSEAIERAAMDATQDNEVLLSEVKTAVASLPDAQRAILLRVALAGHSYQDVAHTTGLPVGTVKSRLSRARDSLRCRFATGSAYGPARMLAKHTVMRPTGQLPAIN